MARLTYSDITTKTVILYDNAPHIVLAHKVFNKQQRKPVNVTKLKNLISGRVVEHTFHVSDTAEEAELTKQAVVFVYQNQKTGEYIFHVDGDKSDRFPVSTAVVGERGAYLKEGSVVSAVLFEDEVIGIEVPIKVPLAVTEAADAVKGNTSSGATKEVMLETGTRVQVPQFINQGDVVLVNTETGAYAERVEKA